MEPRKPPYSEEAERCVIGSILQDCENISDLCVEKKLFPDDFYVPAHKIIYIAMGEMIGQHKHIDTLTLCEKLKQKGTLDQVGGARNLDEMIMQTPSTAHAEHYINIVKQASIGRRIITQCREGENAVYETDDQESVRSIMEAAFAEMEHKAPTKTIKSVIQSMMNDIEAGIRGDPPEIGVSTGYRCLDLLTPGGMRKGSVYWLSGEPEAGKTSLKCNIIDRLLAQGRIVADLTLEMTMEEEIKKLCSIYCDVDVTGMILGESKTLSIPKKMTEITKLLKSEQFFLADESMVSDTRQFWSWARRMVTRNHVDVIFLDYLQKLTVAGITQHMKIEEQTSLQVQCVNSVAGMLGIPVLSIVEANIDGKVRGSRRADYAGAGHWRLSKTDTRYKPEAPYYTQNLTIETKKARYGPSAANQQLILTGLTGRIEEPREREYQPEYD